LSCSINIQEHVFLNLSYEPFIQGAPRSKPVVPPQEYPPKPFAAQVPRLRRVIRQWRNPPKQWSLGSRLAQTPLTHSPTGRAR